MDGVSLHQVYLNLLMKYGIKNFVKRSQFLSTSYGKYFDLPPTLNNVSDIKQFLQND